MNRLVTRALTMSLLLGAGTLYATDRPTDDLDLEACVNGGVSAFGAFPTQSAEDQFYAQAELEPCINGAVPPDGVLATEPETGPILVDSVRDDPM